MKKVFSLFAVMALIAILSAGCATTYPVGTIYTNLKMPVTTGPAKGAYSKIGVASAKSILGFLATGDCSVAAACANAGIKEIVYIDWEVENILGVVGEYKVIVYGN